MSFYATATAFLMAAFADLQGNAETRPFTRRGFASIALLEAGVSVTGLASFTYDAAAVIGGFF